MAIEKYQFLDEVGVRTLSNNLLRKVDARIAEQMETIMATLTSLQDQINELKGTTEGPTEGTPDTPTEGGNPADETTDPPTTPVDDESSNP